MDIRLISRHYEVTPDLRDYIDRKTERLCKHFDAIHSVEMILSMDGQMSKAELIVGTVRSRKCVAVEEHTDMYAAIDLVVDKVERQVTKMKEKLRSHHERAGGEQTQ